ncbi:MAG: hypothetical protein JJE30_11275 [Desulfuromonadales bacterium]|nr:hypothetical protein [Desulfuromonadales bacterium]
MEQIAMLLNNKHNSLYDVAKCFNKSIKDLIRYGLICNSRIAVDIIGDGVYYVTKHDLEVFILSIQDETIKLTEIYPVNTYKTIYPPEYYVNDEYLYRFEEDCIVPCKDLILFHDDLKLLLNNEPSCQIGVKLSSISPNNNQKSKNDIINPRREESLLTLIATLQEVICGNFTNKNVRKHPSIKGPSDLIAKLAEMRKKGLSKRNLEIIFQEAKESKERNCD